VLLLSRPAQNVSALTFWAGSFFVVGTAFFAGFFFFSRIAGLYLLDASSTASSFENQKISPDIAKGVWGSKIASDGKPLV
jgi:hypothetical protein